MGPTVATAFCAVLKTFADFFLACPGVRPAVPQKSLRFLVFCVVSLASRV
jgi:hypothetical protein